MYSTVHTAWLQIFVRKYFMNFGNALYITKILALKILLLYTEVFCSYCRYMQGNAKWKTFLLQNFP